VWPPTSIALAALVLWEMRYWPGVALGAPLANGWTGVPIETVLGITVGNTLGALAGAYLLVRVARFRSSLRRVRDVLALVVLGAVVSTLVAATVGVARLRLGDAVSADALGSTFRVWWLGTWAATCWWPVRAARRGPLARGAPRPLGRGARATRLLGGVNAFVLSRSEPLAYVTFPFLIWAALRFGPHGAATANSWSPPSPWPTSPTGTGASSTARATTPPHRTDLYGRGGGDLAAARRERGRAASAPRPRARRRGRASPWRSTTTSCRASRWRSTPLRPAATTWQRARSRTRCSTPAR